MGMLDFLGCRISCDTGNIASNCYADPVRYVLTHTLQRVVFLGGGGVWARD